MIGTIARHEWRVLRREPVTWWAGGLLLLAVAYALFGGIVWQWERTSETAATVEETADLRAAAIDAAAQDRASVGSLRAFAALPPGPLAAFSVGLADLSPERAEISVWKRPDTLFGRYQLESPLSLLAGRFDLAFVVLYLLPLFLLALSYNLLSAEREGGTLALVLMQPVSLRRVMVAKVLTRVVLMSVFLAGVGMAGALAAGLDAGDLKRLAGWLAVAWLYGLFWLALAAWVASVARRSESCAAILATLWLAFVLVIPGLLNVVVQTSSPVPSRLEFVTEMRAASADAAKESADLLARYYHEHPELSLNGEQGGFMPAYYASQRAVDERLAPLIADFEQRLARQQELVSRFRFASPAVLAQEAMVEIAGSSLERQRQFTAQAREFLATWHAELSPKIFLGQNPTPDHVESLPSFTFDEPAVSRSRFAAAILGLTLFAAAMLVLALRRLDKVEVAS